MLFSSVYSIDCVISCVRRLLLVVLVVCLMFGFFVWGLGYYLIVGLLVCLFN